LHLVIEVDGPIHTSQVKADHERQTLLESLGLRFVRFSAEEVETHLPEVVNQIRAALNERNPNV
jgi:very-short-patch-repair endonuclease